MSRLDDELERLADISEQQLAARIHAARISGTGPHYCIDCDDPIPQARREAIRGCERCADCQTIHEHMTISRTGKR
ncbi:TraR/DksA C4-type zinc finger protein [Aeromonas schubertii]|uniref:TraR/DksA C4-type zinc finger protein n=1 Tax=Aeromonas schubertii TaxID=652 RepID=A0ABS7V6P5_9GAMM|nr:TraR/DksA C4-type zinc finger protein [Aeromonas schubertii]MBZ6064698.1 TraR/DksA C4-type zinc finger protein [Aeromonas schubertii]